MSNKIKDLGLDFTPDSGENKMVEKIIKENTFLGEHDFILPLSFQTLIIIY